MSAAATKAATASVVVRSRLQEPVATEKREPNTDTIALLHSKVPPHNQTHFNCLVLHWRVRITTHCNDDGSKAVNLGGGSFGVLQLPCS